MNNDTSRLELNTNTNNKLFGRNLASSSLQPYFSISPVNTKYSVLGSVDVRKTPTEPLHNYSVFNSANTFNPSNTPGPWSGYSSNINNESILRNQIFALQRSDQSIYVPNSNSDLYKSPTMNTNTLEQPFHLLFKETIPSTQNIHITQHNTNHTTFNNHSRTQLNNIDVPIQKQIQTRKK